MWQEKREKSTREKEKIGRENQVRNRKDNIWRAHVEGKYHLMKFVSVISAYVLCWMHVSGSAVKYMIYYLIKPAQVLSTESLPAQIAYF